MLGRLREVIPPTAMGWGCRGPVACGCPNWTWGYRGYLTKGEHLAALEEYQRELEEEAADISRRIKELKG